MANKRKYIKSKSGYVHKSLHQLTPDGNIYEQDFMTINQMPVFAPGQIPIYNDSNFIFTVRNSTNGQYNVINGTWVKQDDNEYWTSMNIGEINKSTTDSNYIKPYFSSLTDYAYYGSAVELIRSTINKIIADFPAGIYISDKQFKDIRDKEGNLILFFNEEKQLIEPFLVENPFHVDISSTSIGYVRNPHRYFCLKHTDFTINGNPIITWSVIAEKHNNCPNNGDLLRTVVISDGINDYKIYYYFLDGIEIAGSTSHNILIRPNENVVNTFFKNLDDFSKILLNRDTHPRYKSFFDTYYEVDGVLKMNKKEFIWPISKNGYNIEIVDNRFKDYIQELSTMAEFYDNVWSDNFYRAMAHESVKNLDWTFSRFSDDENIDNDDIDFSRMQMIMRIYGRQLDEIKRYIDGIGFSNNLSYNQENNPTDYTLSDLLELAGWEVKNLFSKDDGLCSEVLYNGESVGYTISEANNEFLRRLKLNSPYIFSQKGTKRCIKTLLSFFGMEENEHYIINDKTYEATNLLDVNKVEEYNTLKSTFDITYQGEYGNLSGIPVKEVEGKIVPWFDTDKSYDDVMYFEMAGGWNIRDTFTVDDINGNEVDLSSKGPFFKETQKYVKYVNDINELLSLPTNYIENHDYVYVFNINTPGIDLETCSHYFYIDNVNYADEIDYNWNWGDKKPLSELKGWYPLTITEMSVNNTSPLGEKLLIYLSYQETTIGNNPHFGNKKYDAGQSWRDRFNSIFRPSIEVQGAYVGIEQEQEEKIANLGFGLKINSTNADKTVVINKDFTDLDAAKILNSKQIDITFFYGTFTKDFIEEYVLFYLTQIIPSTTIFNIIYKPMDTVYGITINNE